MLLLRRIAYVACLLALGGETLTNTIATTAAAAAGTTAVTTSEATTVDEEIAQLQARLQLLRRQKKRYGNGRDPSPGAADVVPPTLRPPTSRPPTFVMLYCLQTAGCTLFSLLLAQLPKTLLIPDLWISDYVKAPERHLFKDLTGIDVVIVKIVINGADPLPRLAEHRALLRPDYTILFHRDPWVQFGRMSNHSYGYECGKPRAKIAALEMLYAHRAQLFDATESYEGLCTEPDAVAKRMASLRLGNGSFDFIRTPFRRQVNEVVRDARARVVKTRSFKFGSGNVHNAVRAYDFNGCRAALKHDFIKFDPPKMCESNVERLSPTLAHRYRTTRAALGVTSPISSTACVVNKTAAFEGTPFMGCRNSGQWQLGDGTLRENKDGASRPPKFVMLYCLQTAGCSLFSLLLAQLPRTVVVPDVFINERTPSRDTSFKDLYGIDVVIVKIVITGADPLPRLAEHRALLRPDYTILFHRDPWVQFGRMSAHSYGYECGKPSAKIAALEMLYTHRAQLFNATESYEGMCMEPDAVVKRMAHLHLGDGSYDFIRAPLQRQARIVAKDAHVHVKGIKFAAGNIHDKNNMEGYDFRGCQAALSCDFNKFDPAKMCDSKVERISPMLAQRYRATRAAVHAAVGVGSAAQHVSGCINSTTAAADLGVTFYGCENAGFRRVKSWAAALMEGKAPSPVEATPALASEPPQSSEVTMDQKLAAIMEGQPVPAAATAAPPAAPAPPTADVNPAKLAAIMEGTPAPAKEAAPTVDSDPAKLAAIMEGTPAPAKEAAPTADSDPAKLAAIMEGKPTPEERER
jgi:hypothetical protein